MSTLQTPDEVKTAPETENKPESKPENKPEGNDNKPEAEKISPEKKSPEAPKKEYSDLVDIITEFCGGARIKMVARRAVRIAGGNRNAKRDPIITEQLPDDADVYIAPPPADDEESEDEETDDLEEEAEEEEEEDENGLCEADRCEDPLETEDKAFEEFLGSEKKVRNWITEYFERCRRFRRRLRDTDGTYLMRLAKRASRLLVINVVTGEFIDTGSKVIDPDAVPALLLAASAALLGAENPTVDISFRNIGGEPRITLRLSAEKGKADTVFFNGIHHYADKANVYFATVPYLRGAFVELCITRVELSSFGLKSPVVFGLPRKP